MALPGGHRVLRGMGIDCVDDGAGVAMSLWDSIFEPTYTTKPAKFGTGLGLFIARRLIREAGGDLYVVPSQNGWKTTLRAVIPLAVRSEE